MQDVCAVSAELSYGNHTLNTTSFGNIVEVTLMSNKHYTNLMLSLFGGNNHTQYFSIENISKLKQTVQMLDSNQAIDKCYNFNDFIKLRHKNYYY